MVRRLLHLLAGVRLRVTVTAVLAVACALGVSAAVVEVVLQHDRHNVLMNTAQVQAREVEALNQALKPPIELPPSPTLESGLVQVLSKGHVIGASRLLRDEPALWSPGDPTIQSFPDASLGPAQDVRIVAEPVKVGKDDGTVAVVVSLDQYDRSLTSVRRLLEIGLPILLGVVGLICWWIVGRALRRIEALRREVAEIATRPGEHRVAVPATDDEVGRLARTLNTMLDRMEHLSARERRFVADASHELRSPIANIRTALEVALHRPESADWPRVAGDVLTEDSRMAQLVEDLLLLARSDEGHLVAASEGRDLLVVARQVVAAGDYAAGPPAVTVSGTSARVLVPGAYLERVIANLVDNARRFALSHVEVLVQSDDRFATLQVHDDGPGVPDAARCRIFERFVRLDEARDRDHGGFGLGLAIVADLCRAYGGTIEVSDGQPGAVFSVRFPLAKAASTRPPVAQSPTAVPSPPREPEAEAAPGWRQAAHR
jgi:signal transduction histidine kinase